MHDNTLRVVVCGDELAEKKRVGFTRIVYEITKRLDSRIGEYLDWDVRLCYPKGSEIKAPDYANIKKVELEPGSAPFRSGVLTKYAKKEKAVLVIMSPTICRYNYSIIGVHDIRPLEKVSNDPFRDRVLERMILSSFLFYKHAKVFTASEYQKERIKAVSSLKEERIFVVGNGWEHINDIESDNAIFNEFPFLMEKNYYLSIGSVAPHKNYKWIYETAIRNPDTCFVVVGNISKSGWGIDESDYRRNNIIFTGYIDDGKMKALMENCKAFIHPAIYEGFGIPPLEALALGKDILISNTSCLPSIYKQAARYFSPYDYDVDLNGLLEAPVEGREVILAENSWEICTDRLIEGIENLYQVMRKIWLE